MVFAACCALVLYGAAAWLSPRVSTPAIELYSRCSDEALASAADIAIPAAPPTPRIATSRAPTEEHALSAHRKAVRDRIADLAAELESEVFDRVAFDSRARAIAADLDETEIEETAEVADDRAAGARMIVCAAELLRLCAERSSTAVAPLAPATREALLRAFETYGEDPKLAFASVRALAALGDERDRLLLVEALTSSADAQRRDLAGFGLRVAATAETVGALRRFIRSATDTRRSELALIALEDIWRVARANSFPADEREACARCFSECAARRDAPIVLRQRAIAALAAVGGAHARDALLATFTDAAGNPDLVRSAAAGLTVLDDPKSAQSLAALLADPLLDDERRVLAAEAIARSRARAPDADDARALAAWTLERSAEDGSNPALSRRALLALSAMRMATRP
jgi:hypothetical protein